jgi:regulator of replication initiation timing
LFTSKKTLQNQINNLERDVSNLKATYASLLEKIQNLESYNKEVLENINSIFFEDKKEEIKNAKDTQAAKYSAAANVFSWDNDDYEEA